MAFSTKIKATHHLQGNVQVYSVRIPEVLLASFKETNFQPFAGAGLSAGRHPQPLGLCPARREQREGAGGCGLLRRQAVDPSGPSEKVSPFATALLGRALCPFFFGFKPFWPPFGFTFGLNSLTGTLQSCRQPWLLPQGFLYVPLQWLSL